LGERHGANGARHSALSKVSSLPDSPQACAYRYSTSS
jgi:hypothetical protein